MNAVEALWHDYGASIIATMICLIQGLDRHHTLRSLGLDVNSPTFFSCPYPYTPLLHSLVNFSLIIELSQEKRGRLLHGFEKGKPKDRPSMAHKFRGLPVLWDTPFESGFG